MECLRVVEVSLSLNLDLKLWNFVKVKVLECKLLYYDYFGLVYIL